MDQSDVIQSKNGASNFLNNTMDQNAQVSVQPSIQQKVIKDQSHMDVKNNVATLCDADVGNTRMLSIYLFNFLILKINIEEKPKGCSDMRILTGLLPNCEP